MTAITAESEGVQGRPATGFPRRRFSGYAYGFRTFVLQGGEDPYFTEDRMEDLIRAVKSEFPDCALTLSVGEKSEKAYRKFREAGADRYLLRHETANREHYERLHLPRH